MSNSIYHSHIVQTRFFDLVFNTASNVSQIWQRKLFKLHWAQTTSMRLENLQSLKERQEKEISENWLYVTYILCL